MITVKPLQAYRSGFCSSTRHDRCRGDYGTAVCDCRCHTETEPEREPAPDLVVPPAHSAGVASVGYAGKLAQAVCSCGWAAPEARRRNHDAFDDARQHLAETWQAVA